MEDEVIRVARTWLDLRLEHLDDPKLDIVDMEHLFMVAAPGWSSTEFDSPLSDDVIVMFADNLGNRYFCYYEASDDAPFWMIGNYNILNITTGMVPIYHIDDYLRKEAPTTSKT